MLELISLKEEGRLQNGDIVKSPSIGTCTIAWITSVNNITVKSSWW